MQVKAARRGLRVVEVPVDYRPRIGRSKVSGTVRGTIGAGTKIVATILRHALRGTGRRVPRARAWTAAPPSPDGRASSATVGQRRLRRSDRRLAVAGLVLTACVLSWALGPPPPDADRPAPRALRRRLRGVPRGARRRARPLPARARGCASRRPSSGGSRSSRRRRCSATTSTATSGRGGCSSTAATPTRWSDRPESPRWRPLRDAVYDGLNHKDYTAIYPPLFQLAARGRGRASTTPSRP